MISFKKFLIVGALGILANTSANANWTTIELPSVQQTISVEATDVAQRKAMGDEVLVDRDVSMEIPLASDTISLEEFNTFFKKDSSTIFERVPGDMLEAEEFSQEEIDADVAQRKAMGDEVLESSNSESEEEELKIDPMTEEEKIAFKEFIEQQKKNELLNKEALERFQAPIIKIIDRQLGKGFLTERAEIKVSITDAPISDIEKNLNPTVQQDGLNSNYFHRVGGQCVVNLNFDTLGRSPYLGEDQDLKLLSSLKNETQKQMLREFIALHEHYHCEFSGVKNPVVFGKDLEQTSKVMKGMQSLASENLFSSYTDTVNENFADVSALMSLVKEYGADNKDLKYVLEVVSTQRQDTFLQNEMGVHFTHFTLENALKPENLKKIEEISNGQDFQSVGLTLANKGAARAFYEKDKMRKATLGDDAFYGSILVEAVILNLQEGGSIIEDTWKKNNGENIITEAAKKFLEIAKKEKLDLDEGASEEAFELLKKHQGEFTKEHQQFKKTMEDLSSHIDKDGAPEDSSAFKRFFQSGDNQTIIQDRIKLLKESFIDKTTKLNLPTPGK
jgi:hypothetical protein